MHPPSALRQRLTTGRVIVRVTGDPSVYIETVRGLGPGVTDVALEGAALVLRVADPDRQTPALVAALVAAGAQVLEVRAEIPALEDVYLHLMGDTQQKSEV